MYLALGTWPTLKVKNLKSFEKRIHGIITPTQTASVPGRLLTFPMPATLPNTHCQAPLTCVQLVQTKCNLFTCTVFSR